MMLLNIALAVFIFIVFVGLSFLVTQVLNRIAKNYHASTSEVFRLLANSQKGLLVFIGAVLAISKLGFDVSALVAGLGLTGFALGFALKDAISNLVAGMMIVIYQPIKLGNVIEVSGSKGEVMDINFRYITIKSENTLDLIPNALLLSNKLSIIERDEQDSIE